MEKRMYFGQPEAFMKDIAKAMHECQSYDVYYDEEVDLAVISFGYKNSVETRDFIFNDGEQFKLFVSFLTMFGFATKKGDIHQAIKVITG